jgi:AAHS family 4-hydroxybenzoate transporter-like MFS transporter
MNHDAPASPLDVGALIETGRVRPFQAGLVLLGGLVALVDGFDLSAIGATIPEMARDWAIAPAVFGPAVSAGLVGVAAGSMLAGPISDRFGRRRPLIVMLLLVSVFMVANSLVRNLTELTICRMLVGVAVGGTLPTIISLTSEYMPAKVRAFLTVLMFSGAPLGGGVVNFIGAPVIDSFGWRGILVLGSVAPLLIAIALFLWLPESLRYLVLSNGKPRDIERLVLKVDPTVRIAKVSGYVAHEPAISRSTVSELLGAGRAAATLMLWLVFACTQSLMFMLSGWLPTLLKEQGMTLAAALYVTTAFQLGGGIGSIFCGWVSDKLPADRVLAVMFLIAALATPIFALAHGPMWQYYLLAAAIGLGSLGAQVCLNAYAAQLYPTRIRATGIGWALGVGRLGSIASPLVVGLLLGAGYTTQAILLGASVPAFICLAGIVAMSFLQGRATRAGVGP